MQAWRLEQRMIANEFDYMALGSRLRKCRQAMDMTQGQLACYAGVTSSFIGHIERGEKKASLETLARIAEVLNTTLDYLALGKKARCSVVCCPLYVDLNEMLKRYH